MNHMAELPDATLQNLLTKISQGDAAAFERLYRHYNNKVYAYLTFKYPKCMELDEITNDVFLAIYKKPLAFQFNSRYSTYLLSIASKKASQRIEEKFMGSEEEINHIEEPTGDYVKQGIAWEDEQAVRSCRDDLPLSQRMVIFLAYYEGLGIQEIAIEQKCPVGTVKSRLFKARQSMRLCLIRWNEGAFNE
jgi:RNA polymerase sigma-70 factor, ECF subfamily